ALGGLADGGERLGQQLVEILARVEALAELDRVGGQLVVGQRLELRLQRVHVDHALLQPFQGAALAGPQDLVEHAHRTRMVPTGPWGTVGPARYEPFTRASARSARSCRRAACRSRSPR